MTTLPGAAQDTCTNLSARTSDAVWLSDAPSSCQSETFSRVPADRPTRPTLTISRFLAARLHMLPATEAYLDTRTGRLAKGDSSSPLRERSISTRPYHRRLIRGRETTLFQVVI